MWHVFPVDGALEIPLRGPKGEPVDFARTIVSHGVAELPPNKVDLPGRTLETTLPIPRGARTVRLTSRDGNLHVDTVAGTFHQRLAETIAHMFRLDEDLSGFYALVGEDDLAWCTTGAGRMLRAPTVFEDVVKTICTPIRQSPPRRGPIRCLTASRRPAGHACDQEVERSPLGCHRQAPKRKPALAGAVFRNELRHPGVSGKRVREHIVGEIG
jgi:hypothetical protein